MEAENGAFNVPLCVESSHERADSTVIRYNERCCATASSRNERKKKFSYKGKQKSLSSLKIWVVLRKICTSKVGEKHIYARGREEKDTKTRNSKYFSGHKDHRYCYYEQEKYFEKNKRMNKILTEFLFG